MGFPSRFGVRESIVGVRPLAGKVQMSARSSQSFFPSIYPKAIAAPSGL